MYGARAKFCEGCQREPPVEAFDSRGDGSGRLQKLCRECMAAGAHERQLKKKNSLRNSQIKYKYGITLAAYEEVLEIQGGVCAICKEPPGEASTRPRRKKTLSVDHSHLTGQLRGLLCTNCNLGLGSFFDDPELLVRAAVYLRMWHGRPTKAAEEVDVLLKELMGS